MKTVMKKMFSLMLVAVLMVGALPFSASADDTLVGVRFFVDESSISSSNGAVATTTVGGTIATAPITPNANFKEWVVLSQAADGATKTGNVFKLGETAVNNNTWVVATYNSCTGAPDCTYEPHADTCQSLKCNVSGCQLPKHTTGKHDWQCTKTAGCTYAANHSEALCSDQTACDDFNGCTLPDGHGGKHSNQCQTENCEFVKDHNTKHSFQCQTEGCEFAKDHTTKHSFQCQNEKCEWNQHTGKHSYQCQTEGCEKDLHPSSEPHSSECNECHQLSGKHTEQCSKFECACGLPAILSSQHASTCKFYESPSATVAPGNSKLTVWVEEWVGGTYKGELYKVEFTGLASSTNIAYFVNTHLNEIYGNAPAGYDMKSYEIFKGSDRNTLIDSSLSVGTENSVRVRVWAPSDYVYIYVHTGRVWANDRVIHLDGKNFKNHVISYNDVLGLVDDYYNLNSMSMFKLDQWSRYVNGNAETPVTAIDLQNGVTEVHVLISGTAKGVYSTVKADSSNPKTGDMIMMPVAVLGLSASALAVMFYLNKKRAY